MKNQKVDINVINPIKNYLCDNDNDLEKTSINKH